MELTKEQVQKNAIAVVATLEKTIGALQKTIVSLSEQLEDVDARLAIELVENERLLEIIELGKTDG